jgi:hypothetical protein
MRRSPNSISVGDDVILVVSRNSGKIYKCPSGDEVTYTIQFKDGKIMPGCQRHWFEVVD